MIAIFAAGRNIYRSYVKLFRGAPGLSRLSAIALLGRIPSGMIGIALVLLLERETSSYGVAGAGAGLYAAGSAFAGLLYGRLIGRYGYRLTLVPGGLVAGALLAIIPLVTDLAPVGFALCVCFLSGLAYPPLAACIRGQWNRSYRDPALLARASTLESVLGECAFLVGPLLVSGLLIVASDAWSFFLAGALIAGAAVTFGMSALPVAVHEGVNASGDRSWRRRLRLHAVLFAGLLWCVSFGILAVTVVAAGAEAGSRSAGGVLLAILSAGAIVGGLSLGARDWTGSAARLALLSLSLYGLLILPLAAVAHQLILVAIVLAFTGTSSAIVLATLNLRVVHAVPAHAEVEAYGWLIAATVAGLAVGPALGGQLIEALGVPSTFLVAAAAALLGAVALVIDVRAPLVPTTSQRQGWRA